MEVKKRSLIKRFTKEGKHHDIDKTANINTKILFTRQTHTLIQDFTIQYSIASFPQFGTIYTFMSPSCITYHYPIILY